MRTKETHKLVDPPVWKTPKEAERDRIDYEKDRRSGKIKRLTDYKKGLNILPVFKQDKASDLVNEILREDEQIRNYVIQNPEYRQFLEEKVLQNFNKYKGVLRGAKVVDSWDRVTSALGLVGDAIGPISGGLGNIFSAGEEIVELIPKSIYAVYYGTKTKDWKALKKWSVAEAASFVPYLGDFIDLSNIYVNRARKFTKEKSKEDFIKLIKGGLEKKLISQYNKI